MYYLFEIPIIMIYWNKLQMRRDAIEGNFSITVNTEFAESYAIFQKKISSKFLSTSREKLIDMEY